tara:strand:+ start:84 stop:287 length:204 start_codon:yes stop_codon:yes gene_type:complete
MREWNGRCQRCYKETNVHIMSWFNEDLICMDCSDKEEAREDFDTAREADAAAVCQGNYNFPGIGYHR